MLQFPCVRASSNQSPFPLTLVPRRRFENSTSARLKDREARCSLESFSVSFRNFDCRRDAAAIDKFAGSLHDCPSSSKISGIVEEIFYGSPLRE